MSKNDKLKKIAYTDENIILASNTSQICLDKEFFVNELQLLNANYMA